MESRHTETLGWTQLVAAATREGVHAAAPMFDHGIDLLLFKPRPFICRPVQLKTASGRTGVRFTADTKYEPIGSLIMAYVCVDGPIYLMSFQESIDLVAQRGWTWQNRKDGSRFYETDSAGLHRLLAEYLATPERWAQLWS